MQFDDIVKKRVGVEQFSSKKPAMEKITEAVMTANMAPTPGNVPILSFVVVDDPDKVERIADICDLDYLKFAPYLIVVCSEPKLVKRLYGGNTDKYVKHHVGYAVENLLLKLTEMGLASNIVEFFADDLLRDLIRIVENQEIELIIPVGYEEFKGKAKNRPRYSLYNRLFFNEFGNRFYKPFNRIRRKDL